jgi:peptidoglycan/LPS O-acetylase OafA/YrhL
MTRLGFTGVALLCCFPVHYAMFNSGAATGLGRFLRNGFLRSLGKFSYAMYLFHFLIASFLRRHIEPYFPSQNVTFSLVSTLAGLAAAYLLAVISWNLVEKHFLRMKRFFPY